MILNAPPLPPALTSITWAQLIVEESPDSDWTGLVAYAAGTVALLGVGSWMENCGLEEDDEKEVSRVAPTREYYTVRLMLL